MAHLSDISINEGNELGDAEKGKSSFFFFFTLYDHGYILENSLSVCNVRYNDALGFCQVKTQPTL